MTNYNTFHKSQSSVQPPEIDTTSSSVVNYIRKNIHTIENDDVTMYEYDEIAVPKDSWELYMKLEQALADIDYLTMLTEDL